MCPQRGILSPSSFAGVGIGRVREAAGIERHRPSIRRAELWKARHGGTRYAAGDRLVERQHAALGSPRAIGEVHRSGLQLSADRTIPMPLGAVASGAGARVETCTACQIRRSERCGRNRVGDQQSVGECMRLRRYHVGASLIGDASCQALGGLLKCGRRRYRRQGSELRTNGLRKLRHFRIFGSAHNLAVGDRSSVIVGQIIENLPRLRRLLHGLGRGGADIHVPCTCWDGDPSTQHAYDNEKRSHL